MSKERPILMNGAMVRALLDGRKTQTRRTDRYMAKYPPTSKPDVGLLSKLRHGESLLVATWDATNGKFSASFCPYGKPGDRLWVRESARLIHHEEGAGIIRYLADDFEKGLVWPDRLKPVLVGNCLPNGCFREAARILLEITGVRVERLQDISDADCIAEGAAGGHSSVPGYNYAATPLEHYRHIWQSINGHGSWDVNPWVWVIEFEVVTA